jgi:excinuclease ABC subunit C
MSDKIQDHIKGKVRSLSSSPGVYIFRDEKNRVLYIGKAKNLRKRVGSYFSKKSFDSHKVRILVRQVREIDHIVVDTESDALLLENNLIKEYKPRYNVLLKDDKSFPYICVKNEPFPRIFSTRNPVKDGSLYFGPYTSVHMVRMILEFIRQLYPLRNCNYNLVEENISAGKFKVCLEYHIGNCRGPCAGQQSSEDYDNNIQQIIRILRGNIAGVHNFLREKMEREAKAHEFEEAQLTKEKLELLSKYQSKSTIVNPSITNLDVISFIDSKDFAVSNYIKVVNGAVIKSQTIEIKKVMAEKKEDLLPLVITEMINRTADVSSEIVVPFLPEISPAGFKLTVPVKGDKKRLLDLSTRNARYYLDQKRKVASESKTTGRYDRILERVKLDLGLKVKPSHIECFDNSNIQGSNPVSACVVFKNARPVISEYRHYNITTVTGPNDYASMKEVVLRRYKRLSEDKATLPDLVVVDGGKAQLGAAAEALESLNLSEKVQVIAIAKRLEEIYLPGDPVPVYLDKTSETLRLIQHLRNEAHRFSLKFHRQKRSSVFTRSELDSIPGLGPKSVEKLYRHYKTYQAIIDSDYDEVVSVIGKMRAGILFEYFAGRRE